MWKRHNFSDTELLSPREIIRRPLGFLIIPEGIEVCYSFKLVAFLPVTASKTLKLFRFYFKDQRTPESLTISHREYFSTHSVPNIFQKNLTRVPEKYLFWNTTKSNTLKGNFLVICELLKHNDYVEHLVISASLIGFVRSQSIKTF